MKLATIARALGTLKWWKPLFYLVFWPDSFLLRSGWLATFKDGVPRDAEGDPLPWYPYAATAFVASRLRPDMRVFEWGAGYSTLWYAGRVREVTSCEHDPRWAERLEPLLPRNCTLVVREEGGRYPAEIEQHPPGFDVVVIDGRQRNDCALPAIRALAPDGVILWDDSEQAEFAAGLATLAGHGFKRLDFASMGPITVYEKTTSVFYRERNCFAI